MTNIFDNVTEFVNNNPLIFLVLILLLLIIVIQLLGLNMCNNEHFDSNNAILGTNSVICTKSTSESNTMASCESCKMGNDILLGGLTRFRTTINGKKYYMMIVPYTKCSNLYTTPQSASQANVLTSTRMNECFNNVVVLVDEETMLTGVNKYLNELNDKQKVCNYEQSLQCKGAQCPVTYPQCTIGMKQYPTDFVVQSAGNNKYTIKGVAEPRGIGPGSDYYLNQKIMDIATGFGLLCADISTNTGDNNNILVELLTEQVPVTTGIIGGEVNLRTRIRFNTPIKPIVVDSSGKAMTKSMYMGLCQSGVCTIGGHSFNRICLYDDIINPNVLVFEPIPYKY